MLVYGFNKPKVLEIKAKESARELVSGVSP
jgi:hypothetical protein